MKRKNREKKKEQELESLGAEKKRGLKKRKLRVGLEEKKAGKRVKRGSEVARRVWLRKEGRKNLKKGSFFLLFFSRICFWVRIRKLKLFCDAACYSCCHS